MKNPGIIILISSLLGAGCLFVLWIIGFVFAIGGNLVHLLLTLSLFVGIVGSLVGIVVLIIKK